MAGTEIALRSMNTKMQYAQTLAAAGLLPKEYRQNPANVLFAIEYGEMIGLSPMAAITGVHIIDGKPTASAALISGLVRNKGHRMRIGYDSATRTGWAEIVRKDDPDYTFRCEWDLERAVAAELCTIKDGNPYATDKNGKSLPWRKFYPSMVKHRATAEVARDACQEILFGLYETGEIDSGIVGSTITAVAEREYATPPDLTKPEPEVIDWDAKLAEAAGDVKALGDLYMLAAALAPNDPEVGEKIAAAGKAAKAAAAAAEAAAEAPVVLDAELVEDQPATAGEMANTAQLTAIAAALGEHDVRDRDLRLAVVSLLVGEPIASMKDLMKVEAQHVLDSIRKLAAAGKFGDTIATALALAAEAPTGRDS